MTRLEDKRKIRADFLAEFEAAARRPLEQRWKYASIKTYKPVMDDARFRAFDSMEDYRQWCELIRRKIRLFIRVIGAISG